MNARIVAVTKPLIEGLNAEQFIVYAARVSNPSNQLNTETAPKLLKYCIKHGHWSIFEQSSMTVEIQTSRAISAQILRHRSFCFQEFSQRYSVATEFEPIEFRTQDTKNRQGSGHTVEWNGSDVIEVLKKCESLYEELISKGISKETARMVLPLCTKTTLYMTGNVRSWIHYFQQRCAEGTQKEHRLIACKIRDEFKQYFPITHDLISQR